MPRRLASIAALAAVCAAAPGALAAGFDLIGYLDPSTSNNYVDVYGWAHPSNGHSYALVGNNGTGLHIVDVTDPTNPFQASVISAVPRYDMKTFGKLVYTVDGLPNGPGGIVDLSNPSNPVVVGSFPGGHNLWIDSKGFMYVALPGLTCYDLNDDPTEPKFAWDIPGVDGHDSYVDGDILFDFRGYAGTFIYDVSDRYAPHGLGAITDPLVEFHHQGRLTTDGRYLYLCDEFALTPQPDITIWDLSAIWNPAKVGAIYDPTATAHYCYVVGNTLAVAYFTAGFKLYDISIPTLPVLMDAYDTSPMTGEGVFTGAYGCFAFGPAGTMYVSDRPNGLYVFQMDFATAIEHAPTGALSVGPNSPNPFGASTTIPFRLERSEDASLVVYDARGARVRELRNGFVLAGGHAVEWDGRDDAGGTVASGVYFCKLRAGRREAIGKLVLVR